MQTLTSNNAFYHKSFYNDFNDNHYERLVKRVQKPSPESSLYSTQTIPQNEKKNWSKKSSVFVLWQRGLEG